MMAKDELDRAVRDTLFNLKKLVDEYTGISEGLNLYISEDGENGFCYTVRKENEKKLFDDYQYFM